MASFLKKRGKVYYAQYYIGTKQKRVSLETMSYQVAKEKIRDIESALSMGSDSPLPSKTPLEKILQKYVVHIRTVKTAKSAQTDVYYLRQMFGPICTGLQVTIRKVSAKALKRPPKPGQDRRFKASVIEVGYFEQITTEAISSFISAKVRSTGIAPKTANRYREIMCRLFNWAMAEGGVKMPNDKNPAAKVGRYKESAPKIRFLTLPQIDEQLNALSDCPQIKIMVAMYIYAGLRREELLWLRQEDINLKAGYNGMIRIQAKTVNDESCEPKTKVNRAVPISSSLRSVLEYYRVRPSFGDWYFPSPQGHRYDPDNFSSDLRAANHKVGLKWTCLDFRHTFGSQLAMKGESLYKISTLLGNSPEICKRHYAALLPESLFNTVDFASKTSVN